MWASWPLERSVVLDGACNRSAVRTFGAARFTAEIVWPLAVITLEIFRFSAKPTFSPVVTVSGKAPVLAVAVAAEPVATPGGQPLSAREARLQYTRKATQKPPAPSLF